MVLDFLNTIYPWLFPIFGGIAVAMGFDRLIKSEDEESDVLQWIAGVAGIILVLMTVLLMNNEFSSPEHIITKYSILFSLLLGLALIARPFQRLPLAFVVSVFILLGLSWFVVANQESLSVGGIGLDIIIIIILIIVGIVFIISFVQEQAMDTMLFVLGWGPIVTTLGLAILVQGITLIINWPDADGILGILPG